MKNKQHLIVYITLLFIPFLSNGQITLDHTVYPWNGYRFYPVKISENETKYVVTDSATNTFDLLNLDYTPFITNIQLPALLYLNQYQIMYVSRSLFDCDSSNIEFMYESPNNYAQTFYIIRTDGTILFQKDSTRSPYCIGCYGGSQDVRPIYNTENGAKLQLFSGVGIWRTLEIYSLCGTLVQNMFEITRGLDIQVNVYPNPTVGKLYFEFNWNTNDDELLLYLLDASGKEIYNYRITSGNRIHEIDINEYSTGTYFYKISNNKDISQSGKFVIAK